MAGLEKDMEKLKVGKGSPGAKARRGSDMAADQVNQARRRLSMMSAENAKSHKLDGDKAGNDDEKKGSSKAGPVSPASPPSKGNGKPRFSSYSSLSRVGYIPFNSDKVNQDRACVRLEFGGNKDRAFFGCFDGHGSFGHEVSEFCQAQLPEFFLKEGDKLQKEPQKASTRAFVACNNALTSGRVDCTFSGTTVVVCYVDGDTIYTCNAGDSRAVLCQKKDGKLVAKDLSIDQKPELESEKKRIIASGGRVEACKGARGEDIGPSRVWLLNQDMPGLAMTRSFGDLIAASVGVVPTPDITEHHIDPEVDQFFIMASDGVWEFISSQEAVEMAANGKTPEEACKILVEEATKRWKREEEVIDDITAIVVYITNK